MGRAATIYTHFTADLTKFVAHRPSILHWIMTSRGGLRRDRHGHVPSYPAVD
jgi:hypothetical protein